MLKQRVITAVVLLLILLPALFYPSFEPFCALALLLVAAGGWEWARLNGLPGAGALALGAAVAALCAAAWGMGLLARPLQPLWLLAGALWVLGGAWLLRAGPVGWSQLPRMLRLGAGVVVLSVAWLAIAQAKLLGVNFLLSVLLLVWVADIFAYFAGRSFGGRLHKQKLAPSISPGKSWEGVWGGMAGVLVLAWCWQAADAHWHAAVPSLYSRLMAGGAVVMVIGAVFLAAMSVVGDLVESLMKRSAGAKDSSNLLPGHGGVLDRLDALLPTLPLAMMLTQVGAMSATTRPQRVTILGATGSIGTSTLNVMARHPERFEAFALTAATQVDLLAQQCLQFKPRYAVMASDTHARALAAKLKEAGSATQVLGGAAAITQVAAEPEVDTVMAAIVGAAGLAPCLAAAEAGKRLLLANKEALVVGGQVFLDAVARGGATLLPIDSEHSAIFQSLPEDRASWAGRVDKIILTASGGPFRTRDPATLRDVTPEQACAHPNWVMGRKISVDSATMMNKALEVIEARYLFGVAPEQLQVVIHPQSVIHSMVQYTDHSVIAQLGTPDMRGPIAYGLSWPDRMVSGASALDFTTLADMSFESFDTRGHRQRFPGLQLAWDVLAGAPGATAVLNAANEIAVEAFLAKRIRFDQIHQVNQGTLETVHPSKPHTLEDLLTLDADTRAAASRIVAHLAA